MVRRRVVVVLAVAVVTEEGVAVVVETAYGDAGKDGDTENIGLLAGGGVEMEGCDCEEVEARLLVLVATSFGITTGLKALFSPFSRLERG